MHIGQRNVVIANATADIHVSSDRNPVDRNPVVANARIDAQIAGQVGRRGQLVGGGDLGPTVTAVLKLVKTVGADVIVESATVAGDTATATVQVEVPFRRTTTPAAADASSAATGAEAPPASASENAETNVSPAPAARELG